ncbi:MAG: hypothetical protein PHE09_05600 [Oscillospiraceae bacterium]|nr:hypothetical protein [Oscillospiraceae bacterium]
MSDIASVIIKPSLEEMFLTGWDHCRVIFFAAPCGCDKTTTATALNFDRATTQWMLESPSLMCGLSMLIEGIGSIFHVMTDKQLKMPSFSVTSTLPRIMNVGKNFCEWSKKDNLLYATMRKPLETLLGRDGVGLVDCGLCESKFEEVEDVSKRLLTLMTRLGEIQACGTPNIEFAVMSLLARVQVSQGYAQAVLESIERQRRKFLDTGQTHFLPNIDAMRCAIQLRLETQKPHDCGRETANKATMKILLPLHDLFWSLTSFWKHKYCYLVYGGKHHEKKNLKHFAMLLHGTDAAACDSTGGGNGLHHFHQCADDQRQQC